MEDIVGGYEGGMGNGFHGVHFTMELPSHLHIKLLFLNEFDGNRSFVMETNGLVNGCKGSLANLFAQLVEAFKAAFGGVIKRVKPFFGGFSMARLNVKLGRRWKGKDQRKASLMEMNRGIEKGDMPVNWGFR